MKPRELPEDDEIVVCAKWAKNNGVWIRTEPREPPFIARIEDLRRVDADILNKYDGRILYELRIPWNEE